MITLDDLSREIQSAASGYRAEMRLDRGPDDAEIRRVAAALLAEISDDMSIVAELGGVNYAAVDTEPRAADGKWTTGGGSAKASKPAKEPSTDDHKQFAHARKVIKTLGAAGQWIKSKTRAMFDRLEKRYGRRNAVAIFAAGQALSWGAFGVGIATGVPLYIPSAVATAPFAAIAEVHKQVKRALKPVGYDADLSDEEVQRLAGELVEEVKKTCNERDTMQPNFLPPTKPANYCNFLPPVLYETHHAPAGGITIGGKKFKPGEFIPGDKVERATPEERARLEKRKDLFDMEPEEKPNFLPPNPENRTDSLDKPSGKADNIPVGKSEPGPEKKAVTATQPKTPRSIAAAEAMAASKEAHELDESGPSKAALEASDAAAIHTGPNPISGTEDALLPREIGNKHMLAFKLHELARDHHAAMGTDYDRMVAREHQKAANLHEKAAKMYFK